MLITVVKHDISHIAIYQNIQVPHSCIIDANLEYYLNLPEVSYYTLRSVYSMDK